MKKCWSLLLIACIAVGMLKGSFYANAKESVDMPEQLYARSAVLMDADSGRVLFGKEEDVARPMASTTKIMTCILALEKMEENAVVTISTNAASQPKVKLGVQESEKYQLMDLLYSLMLESHNDSAVAIAEGISGSVEAFAREMNVKAQEIDCKDSYFVTPNGLDGQDEEGVHSTTAADLARIMRYCIQVSPQKDIFLKITQTQAYSFTNQSGRSFSCGNHNAFLSMMEGALSGKTGFTGDAGYCYVGALKRDGKTFIVALLACGWPNNKSYKWADTKKLMTYGLENYEYRNIWKKVAIEQARVDNGIDKQDFFHKEVNVSLAIENPEPELSLLLRKDERVDVTWNVKKELAAPVRQLEPVGEVTYMLEGAVVHTFNIVATEQVKEKDWSACLRITIEHWFAVLGTRARSL